MELSILHFMHSLGPWALVIFYFYLVIESAAFVGLFIPADLVVVFAGGLAGQNVFSLAGALAAVIGGTTSGDTLGYLIGRRWGRWLVAKWPWLRRKYDQHRRELEERLRNWTVVTILFTRISSLGHSFVPFLCGMAKLRPPHYLAATIASEAVWGGGLVLGGFLLGRHWRTVENWVESLGGGLLSLVIVIVVLTVVRRWFYRWRQNP